MLGGYFDCVARSGHFVQIPRNKQAASSQKMKLSFSTFAQENVCRYRCFYILKKIVLNKLNSRDVVLVCVFLGLATLAVYWPLGSYEFNNFDDPKYVAENPIVQKGLTKESVAWAFTNGYASMWHPLTWLSHMLDCELFGLKAGAHHLVNVGFHIANALLLLLVIMRMTGAFWSSAIVSGLFAWHPLHVESVAWVAERKDLLSTFFWMLAMWAYVWYVERRSIARYLLVVLSFTLGLMAKPMLVTLPFVLLLLDYWPLGRLQLGSSFQAEPQESKTNYGRHGKVNAGPEKSSSLFPFGYLVVEKLPLFVLSLVFSLVTFFVAKANAQSLNESPFHARLANALVSYVRYLGKMICPENLSVIYPYPGGWALWQVTGASILLAILTLLFLGFVRHRPYFTVGWFWYLGTLVPVIGLVQIGFQSMADRFTYIPLIGLFLAVTWGVNDLTTKWPWRRMTAGLAAGLILIICLAITLGQVQHWRNSVNLFTHALSVTTNNFVAHYSLGQALSMRGKLEEPILHYQEALRIKPDFDKAHNNLGLALVRMGKIQEGIKHYAQALQSNPANADAHFNLAVTLASQGKLEEAASHYTNLLRISPEDYVARNGLGKALSAQNKLDDAIFHFTEALRVKRDCVEARHNLAETLTRQGRLEEATAQFSEVLRWQPALAEVRSKLGLVLSKQGKTKEALEQYREALRLKPDFVEALNNLAWILATHSKPEFRNGAEAVSLARRACQLTSYTLAPLVGTLAAAYAESGHFQEAVETTKKAHELAEAAHQTELAATNQKLLELYQAGQPYREPN